MLNDENNKTQSFNGRGATKVDVRRWIHVIGVYRSRSIADAIKFRMGKKNEQIEHLLRKDKTQSNQRSIYRPKYAMYTRISEHSFRPIAWD